MLFIYLLFIMIMMLCFKPLYCNDNGFTLGIRDSIMVAHSFKGGIFNLY